MDLVIGSRFCNGNGQEIPAYRKVGMRILDITTRIVGGISVTDSQSGFRAFAWQTRERRSGKAARDNWVDLDLIL